MKSPHKDYIHDPTFRHYGLVFLSGVISSKLALAEHVCETRRGNIAWDDSRLITTNNRYGQRLCLEAWHINASPWALNRLDGRYLPQEHSHLVSR